MGIKVSWK